MSMHAEVTGESAQGIYSILNREATLLELATFKHPKAWIVVDELPRNAMGKVQRATLRADYGHLFARPELVSTKV